MAELGKTRRRLERWRERYGGPGKPIPEELWDEAVEIARVEGVGATAQALRLDRARLRRRMEGMSSSGSVSNETGGANDGFVEVDARGVWSPAPTVLRFEGRDGERLRVELSATCTLDVADLARAFWGRER